MLDKDEDSMLVFIDQEKAYDRVERPWVYKVMKKVNIGDCFIAWIKALYHDGQTCIITNSF